MSLRNRYALFASQLAHLRVPKSLQLSRRHERNIERGFLRKSVR